MALIWLSEPTPLKTVRKSAFYIFPSVWNILASKNRFKLKKSFKVFYTEQHVMC